jgi:GNAT superfamily N-acetyltransferase
LKSLSASSSPAPECGIQSPACLPAVDLGQHGRVQRFYNNLDGRGRTKDGICKVYASAYLTKSQIEAAYVLVAAFASDISPGTWRRFCAGALEAPDRGPRIAIVTDPADRLRGVAVAQATGTGADASLFVPIFAPLSAADVPGITRALLDFLLAEARLRGCTDIHFGSLHPDSWTSYIASGTLPPSPGTMIRVPA